MEQLISTLLGSPLLLFAIIAIISFLGRMAKGAGQTNQQQGQNQPQQKQEESKEINWRDIFTQEEVKAEPQPRQQQEPEMVTDQYAPSQHREQETTQVANGRNDLYDRLEEYKRRKRETEEQAPGQVQLSATSDNRKHSSGHLDISVRNLSKQEAMKAVVWAEVLGKPRSRNPHKAFAPTRHK